jgi:hypothetical protein
MQKKGFFLVRHYLKALQGKVIKVSAIISKLELHHNGRRGEWRLLLLEVKRIGKKYILADHLWIDCGHDKNLIKLGSRSGEEIRFYGTVIQYFSTLSGEPKENYTLQFDRLVKSPCNKKFL